jgi:hypothetical protein
MKSHYWRRRVHAGWVVAALLAALSGTGCSGQPEATRRMRRLTHEETLAWIGEQQAWRLARKTKPIWARPVRADEIGKEFQTADRVVEVAREGYWLCVGVAGEPWFQKPEKIGSRYERGDEEMKQFAFDPVPRAYTVYRPRGDVLNWVARVGGGDIEGFSVRAPYDRDHPLYSPAGGYVVKDHVADPYGDRPDDVWLVQQSLFESTYELVP